MDISLSLSEIKGIGPKTAEAFAHAGFVTIRDLIYYLPRTYENYQCVGQIADLRPGKITIRAMAEDIKTSQNRRGLTITEASLRDKTGAIRAIWFNQPYRAKQFRPGKEYYFTGDFGFLYGRYQLTNPAATLASDFEKVGDAIVPIYSAKAPLKPGAVKKAISLFKSSFHQIPDLLPNYPGRGNALFMSHFPESQKDIEQGRAYLAFEELFIITMASQLNRQNHESLTAMPIPFDLKLFKSFLATLPFSLTNAQRRAAWSVIQDLAQEIPMNRLLQGDVGSGKTIIAGLAAFVSAKAHHQTALLAPTEILAAQHADTLCSLLMPFGIKIALLTASTKDKSALKSKIKSGEIDLVIGTHALLTDDTQFRSLALAIIDEQHRFGVGQRQKLLAKISTSETNAESVPVVVPAPHLLSMTATPIPRSLQLTIFGDLAISILDELPAGRRPIITKIIPTVSLDPIHAHLDETTARGHQAYYICRSIEESSQDFINVKSQTQKLRFRHPHLTIECIHGRMKPSEKSVIMDNFLANRIHILVSTTVVEVGVNNPNATTIIIADADHYGLAQLHQLRGRVGRGSAQSHCFLLTDSTQRPSRRLCEIEKSTDGFYLAEIDLKLRGPGQIYGAIQHGALDFNIASATDTKTFAAASAAVATFLHSGENMLNYPELAIAVNKYRRLTTLN
jgi:ATP-dependent DNA helicase RecG